MKHPPIATITPTQPGVCAPCGCTFNMGGSPMAQCRLHGQSRQIQATIRILLQEYDKFGKIVLHPGDTLNELRRFAS